MLQDKNNENIRFKSHSHQVRVGVNQKDDHFSDLVNQYFTSFWNQEMKPF